MNWLMMCCGLVLGGAILTGCQRQPTETVNYGETLQTVRFDHDFEWENYANAAQKVAFAVEHGAYRTRAWDGGFTWTLNAQAHTDVVIQADVEQLSDYGDNAFGLMCRASPANNGDGYFFFISGDGYTLRRGASSEVLPIIPWTYTDTIEQGRSINRIRIVCVEDYLALYVNGQFVDEARDRLFAGGYAGLSAAVPEGGNVDVQFDDVVIRAAALEKRAAATAPAEPE